MAKALYIERLWNGKYIRIPYDTKHIKTHCIDCGGTIKDPQKNYERRGNWCEHCNGKYSEKPHIKVLNT